MKKLMMTAAIVCAALGVRASCADWQVMSQYADVGASLYAVDASALSGKDLAKLTFTDVTDNAFNWADSAGKPAAANPMGAVATTASKATFGTLNDADLTSSSSIYWVLVKDDQYALMNGGNPYAVPSAKVYDAGMPSPGAIMINEMAVTHTYKQFSSSDVPEPTSGLLLLLGVAGLALRRRRA